MVLRLPTITPTMMIRASLVPSNALICSQCALQRRNFLIKQTLIKNYKVRHIKKVLNLIRL